MSTGSGYDRPVEILLVEDSPSDANLAIAALKEGAVRNHVHHVEDGAEAMAFLRHEHPFPQAPRPDLILLDLNLPKMDGYQVLSEIQQDARFREIPAIVLTASADPHDIEASYDLGASFYITKPADLHEFITTMEAVKDAVAALRRLGVDIDRFLSNRVGNLDLTRTDVRNESLGHVRGLSQLKRLWLAHTAITDAGLIYVAELVNLTLLDLQATQITDAGLAHLRALTQLAELNLAETGITDTGLAHLAGLNRLERLDLRATRISDDAVPTLAELARLEELNVADCQLSPQALDQLRAALPETHLVVDP